MMVLIFFKKQPVFIFPCIVAPLKKKKKSGKNIYLNKQSKSSDVIAKFGLGSDRSPS